MSNAPIIEAAAVLSNGPLGRPSAPGYCPQIRWGGIVVWEDPYNVIPFEHGDYNNDQERKAIEIAENRIQEKLQELFA